MNRIHAQNKRRIYEYLSAVASAHQAPESTREYYHDDIVWHGPAPLDTLRGIDALWSAAVAAASAQLLRAAPPY